MRGVLDRPLRYHRRSPAKRIETAVNQPWDFLVIGGGTAGIVGAKTAAGFGARVLLIEPDRPGGDCLWTGCVPSKTLIAQAHRWHSVAETLPGSRISDGDREQAMTAVQAAINEIAPVDSVEALEAAGVHVRGGRAAFDSPSSVRLDGERIEFTRALIATGAAPRVPLIDGITAIRPLTSETLWDLTALPRSLAIIGGGPIACELSQALSRLGVAVTLVHRGSRILSGEDPDAAELVRAALERDGVSIRAGRTTVRITSDDGLAGALELDDASTVPFERLLIAVGREPRTAGLNLPAGGIETADDGSVRVDASLRSVGNTRVWAAGDVTSVSRFTHTAGMHASTAATNAMLGLRRRISTDTQPRVTFTVPEVAAVGIQPHEADPRKHRVISWTHEHADRAVTERDTHGFARIVVDRRHRIVGATVVGPRAGETLGEVGLAVARKLSTSAVAGVTHAYPTYNDAFWNAAISDVRRTLSSPLIRGFTRQLVRIRSRAT